jgi:hypothetical protein
MSTMLLTWVLATSAGLTGLGQPDSLRLLALQSSLQSFGAAFLKSDAAALDTFLVDSYLHTNRASGTVLDKPRWLDYIRQRRADLQSGRLRIHRYETLEPAIRWFPSAAVVSTQVVSEGLQDGRHFLTRLQVTQVWVQIDGQWRRAAFHDSPLPDR